VCARRDVQTVPGPPVQKASCPAESVHERATLAIICEEFQATLDREDEWQMYEKTLECER